MTGVQTCALPISGDVDPAHADEWSRAGTAALDATATPPVPAPVAPRLRSPASGDLPKTAAPPVSALTPPGALPAADADALTTLDLNMGPKLPGEVSRFLAPALAADQRHATEVAAVKEEAGAGRGRIDSELEAAIRAIPETAYEKFVQSRAQELLTLLKRNDRDAFDAKLRTFQGYP